jgi:hypothetical protein
MPAKPPMPTRPRIFSSSFPSLSAHSVKNAANDFADPLRLDELARREP